MLFADWRSFQRRLEGWATALSLSNITAWHLGGMLSENRKASAIFDLGMSDIKNMSDKAGISWCGSDQLNLPYLFQHITTCEKSLPSMCTQALLFLHSSRLGTAKFNWRLTILRLDTYGA